MPIYYIPEIITKSLEVKSSKDRLFQGYATVQMVDKDGEITVRDALYKQFHIWAKRGAPIIDVHTNRVIGKGLNFAKAKVRDPKTKKMLRAIRMEGQIYNDYEADHRVWKMIVSGEYKGLSFGGANKSTREPVTLKNGKTAYKLEDLELYEMSVCFPADTEVLMADESTKPISEVKVGDSVIGHDGKPHVVKYKHKRDYKGWMHIINTGYHGKIKRYTSEKRIGEVHCTPEHPFMMKNGKFKAAKDLKKLDEVRTAYVVWNKGLHGRNNYKGGASAYQQVKDSYQKNKELERIELERKKYEDAGYRYITIAHHAIPDAIAIKGDEVRAVEVQYDRAPNVAKYEQFSHDYDAVDWILKTHRTKEHSVTLSSAQIKSTGKKSGYEYDGEVYNLDVDDVHTYVANGFVVHNCKTPTAPLAVITEYSHVAKSKDGGQTMVRCNNSMCYVVTDKAEVTQKELNTRLDESIVLTQKKDEEMEIEEEDEKSKDVKSTETKSEGIEEKLEKAMSLMTEYAKSQNEINDSIFKELAKMSDAKKASEKPKKKAESAVDKAIREFEESIAKAKDDDEEEEDKADDEDMDDDEDKMSHGKKKKKAADYTEAERPAAEGGDAPAGGNEMLAKARELGSGNLGKLVAYSKTLEAKYR